MNIHPILYQILSAISAQAADDYEIVKSQAEEIVSDAKERLKTVGVELLNGNITKEFAADRLKEEIIILESQLLSNAVILKSFAQETINGLIEKFNAFIESVKA